MKKQEYTERTLDIEIPKGSGVEGFILAIRRILKLPRVTEIKVNARGKVTFQRLMREGEADADLSMDFDSVSPSAIIRNTQLTEIETPSPNAAATVAALLDRAHFLQLFPIAFVGGASSWFHDWHRTSTGINIAGESVFGLPFLRDRHIPDEALVLLTGFNREGSLIDTRASFKVLIPHQPAVSDRIDPTP